MKFNFHVYFYSTTLSSCFASFETVLCSEAVSLSHVATIKGGLAPVTCTSFLGRACLLMALTHTSTYFTAPQFLMSGITMCHTSGGPVWTSGQQPLQP